MDNNHSCWQPLNQCPDWKPSFLNGNGWKRRRSWPGKDEHFQMASSQFLAMGGSKGQWHSDNNIVTWLVHIEEDNLWCLMEGCGFWCLLKRMVFIVSVDEDCLWGLLMRMVFIVSVGEDGLWCPLIRMVYGVCCWGWFLVSAEEDGFYWVCWWGWLMVSVEEDDF
jgi:hypothetical protein